MLGRRASRNRPIGPLPSARRVRERSEMQILSRTEVLSGIAAMVVLELYHLKWIWLSEWNCRRCSKKNLECACGGRWIRYL